MNKPANTAKGFVNSAGTELPPASGFRLLRYFTLASLAAFVVMMVPLVYVSEMYGELFAQVLREQNVSFARAQDGFAKQQKEASLRDLMTVHEADNINLTRLFANMLWEKDLAPLVAKVQRISVEHCRAIADAKDASGKAVQPDEKKACYAGIGKNIRAFPEFRTIDAKVFEAMKKSTVFKIKVYDLRGITVYSSEHSQIGEDKVDNTGWQAARDGKTASKLSHRDKFSAFEGVVADRDLFEIYIPATVPDSDRIVGVFEVYSDVTPFLSQIQNTTAEVQKKSAETQKQLEQDAVGGHDKADSYAIKLFAIVLALIVFLYLALLQIVRNGQRIIDREMSERRRAEQEHAESEARFRSLTEMSSDFYWESDTEHRLTQRSASSKEGSESVFHGISPVGKRRWDLPYISPDEAGWQKHREILDAHLPFRDFELSRLAADGGERHIAVSGNPMFDASGSFLGYRGVGTDITQRKLAEANLRIAATAFEAQEGIFITDAGNVILRVNRAFTEITGYTAAEAVGQTPRLLRSGRQDADFYRAMWDSVLNSGTWSGEIWNRRKNGEVYPELLTITAVRNSDGSVVNYVATLNDITVRKAAEEEIKNLAFYDPLTQLPNRRLLMDRLHQALASSDRSQRRGALLFIDLDHFKTLNDTLGHDKGDLLLQQVAQRLTACVRASDTVARQGGDEFVVMLEDLSEIAVEAEEQTRRIAKKILATFNQPYVLAGHPHESSGSIGIALFLGNNQSAIVLLKHADIAMYQAKAAGRNAMRFFEPGMQVDVAVTSQTGEAPGAS